MKITIIHKSENLFGQKKVFVDQAVIRIGRRSENDLVFDDSGARVVSSFHAEIRIEDGIVTIEDLDSTNGVYVDGKIVSKVNLKPGMFVELGEYGPSFEVDFFDSDVDTKISIAAEKQEEKKYGEKTVGMMVKQALLSAGILKTNSSKSTQDFEALVDNKIEKTSSKYKLIIIIGLIVFVIAGIGLGIFIYRNRSVQYFQTTQVNMGGAAGSSIAASNRYSVFLLAGKMANSNEYKGFCSAFSISPNMLATNAHCINSAKKYSDILVLMNGAPKNRYRVAKMLSHGAYKDGFISPDVGILIIDGSLMNYVILATAEELGQILPGVSIFLYGFPGRLNKEEAPEATFVKGEIGRVTSFDKSFKNLGTNTILQHSAYSATGTSGSPMFNSNGHVIGINAGGYVENDKVLTGYNFGFRIDLIYPLIYEMEKR